MAEFPAFPLWTDAYLGDTTHLTTIEHGAYLLLLIAMWRTPDGTLPDDDAMLARYTKMRGTNWASIAPIIRPFLTKLENGRLTQNRLLDEREFQILRSGKQSKKAKSRWLKNKKTTDAAGYATALPRDMPDACRDDAPLPSPSPSKDSDSSESDIPSNARELVNGHAFDAWYDLFPNKIGKAAAKKAWPAALKRAESFDALVGGLNRYIATKPRDRAWCNPATWLNQDRWLDEPAGSSDGAEFTGMFAK